jgi:hypothetical protein
MATANGKHSRLLAQPKRRRLNPHTKTRLYEAVYDLNRGFAITLEVFDRLARLGIFRPDHIKGYRNMAEEVRALTNFEMTAALRDREEREMAVFGRLRRQWENRGEDQKPHPPRRHGDAEKGKRKSTA